MAMITIILIGLGILLAACFIGWFFSETKDAPTLNEYRSGKYEDQ